VLQKSHEIPIFTEKSPAFSGFDLGCALQKIGISDG
jgi:hypothetical protein